jgi:hypothetical protein
LFVFAYFTPAITPPLAAHWSDTEPKFRSEIKNRASVSLLTSATVTVLAFAEFQMHFAHGSLSPQSVKRAANGRMTTAVSKKL